MNTNYSKIALLLALGVIAGDKVGAELGLNQRSLEDLNTPQRKNIVKNEYRKGFDKTKANLSRLAQMDKAVERILGNIESKNGHILSSRAWVGSDGVVTDLGKKILGDSNTVLETYMKHDVLVKNLRSQLEALEKNFNQDIADIKSKKIDSFDFFNIKEGTFKGVKEFIDASQGKDKKVSDIVKGIDGLFSNLNKVDISSSQGNQLLVDFAITLENMTDSAAELGNATVDCTDSASPAPKVPVDLKTGLDNTVNALKDLFAHYAGRYAGCPIVQDSGNQFETMVKRHNFVSEKLSKINFASSAGMKRFLDTILGLNDRAIAEARTKLVENNTKTAVADKDELLAEYLKSVFGEAAAGLDNVATDGRVFEYQSDAGGVALAGDQVGPDEVKYAFGLDGAGGVMGKFAAGGTFKTTSTEVAKVEPLFNFVDGFRSGISDAKANSTSAVKDGRTILKAFAKSDGFAQKAPSISLRMSAESGFTTETQIKDYFSNTKKRAEQLLKENKATFDASAPAWKIELEGLYRVIDDHFVKSMSGLWGNNVTSEAPGTCKGQTLDSIKRSREEIKEAYDAAIAALGAAPAGAEATPEQIAASKKAAAEKEAADKLAAVKTVEELEALEIFQKGGLKIADLTPGIKDLIKGEKDQTKAQTLFTKILKGFADKTSASIALKTLFDEKIQDNLKVEDDAQPDDVDMLVREAPAGALNQKQTETKPNGKLPQDRKLKLDDEIEGDEVTLQTFDLSGFLNLDTGALAEESDKELKSFNKLLADAMKSLKGKKKSVPVKTKKNKADSIIKELVARFKEDYTGDNPEDAEEDAEKKAATVAKNNAVTAATKLITEKVYKAFGISTKDAPAGKGRKAPVKRGAVKGGRGRVIKRGPRNKSQQKGNKKNEKK